MTEQSNRNITIFGAGLVGSLLAIYLRKQNFGVEVYEKRNDPRASATAAGRSINLALSHRGIKALKEVGLADKVLSHSIPMKGRMIHDMEGRLKFQPYGEEGQMIYSISRRELNQVLIQEAENAGAIFRFNTNVENFRDNCFQLKGHKDKISLDEVHFFVGADGAFSSVRESLKPYTRMNFSQSYTEHGYKELHIPPVEGGHVLDANSLHIWPREKFMLIALPNTDGSFTCTLFLPFEGKISFAALDTEQKVKRFFNTYFADAVKVMPDLVKDFFHNPTSGLVTIKSSPWHFLNKIVLIGDAAHGIVPFYGQGMNAGFEDCRIFNGLLKKHRENLPRLFREFFLQRKENGDAIAELALQNFIEMSDKVADERFLLRKKIEAYIHQQIPEYLPLYSMVTFSDISYSKALARGRREDEMMEDILSIKGIEKKYNKPEGWKEIKKRVKLFLKEE